MISQKFEIEKYLYLNGVQMLKSYEMISNICETKPCLRHSYVKQLLIDGVITIDFVRSCQNLADPLTKGLARDLMWKTSKGMGLKPIQ